MSTVGPQIPSHLLNATNDGDGDKYGPAPPSQAGPQLPHHLMNTEDGDDDDDEEHGPAPPSQAGPQIPPHLSHNLRSTTPPREPGPLAPAGDDQEEDEDAYLPALPPDLVAAPKRTLGPTLPTHAAQTRVHDADDSSDSDEVGPMPAPAGPQASSADDAVREFMEREERRRKADEEARQPKKLQREEWMLVPPSSSSVLGSLDPTKLKARQFSRSANTAPAARDNSLWTETPAERQARIKDEVDGKRRRATEVAADEDDELKQDDRKRRKYEADVKAQIDEYNRKTRGSSLVDMHKSAKSKEKDKDEGPPVIWDHARDMSVGGRLMDEGQRSKMIHDARALGDRFGKGKSGGFL